MLMIYLTIATLFTYPSFIYLLVGCFGAGGLSERSLSIRRIEERFAYIPRPPDPTNSSAICGIYWVWLLLLLL
ncbi:hypothetical protein HanIR_Chr13g0639911 [Helianthus annuus]|nr:hypothetical protein HanIR_Chr13g0639911 [Helianthus annuus]